MHAFTLGTGIACFALLSPELRAQCPDGTPPPCARAASRPAHRVRAQAAGGALAERTRHLRQGGFRAARESACLALTVLPESAQAWPAPPECVVIGVTSRLRGVVAADSVHVALTRALRQVQAFVVSSSLTGNTFGPTEDYTQYHVGLRYITAMSCLGDSCDTTYATEQLILTLLHLEGTPAVIGVFATWELWRHRSATAVAQALGSRVRVLAGWLDVTPNVLANIPDLTEPTVTGAFDSIPLSEALRSFAIPGVRVVAAPGVSNLTVTARFAARRWHDALYDLLASHGLYAVQESASTIRVARLTAAGSRR